MTPATRRAFFGLLLCAAACSSSPDARCSDANCEALHACRVRLEGEPIEPALCGLANVSQSTADAYCVKACQANGQGGLLECIASTFGASCPAADGGYPSLDAIEATCVSNDSCGTNCTACRSQCASSATSCTASCPDAGVCLDCEYTCAQAQLSCSNACPTN